MDDAVEDIFEPEPTDTRVAVPAVVLELIGEAMWQFDKILNTEYRDVHNWEGPEAIKRLATKTCAERLSRFGLARAFLDQSLREADDSSENS